MVEEGRKGRDMMFKTMLVEDSTLFRQVVKNNLQDQFPSMEIKKDLGVRSTRAVAQKPDSKIFETLSFHE